MTDQVVGNVALSTSASYADGRLTSIGKARKLRALTVDKGLLRETKQVLKMVDALVQCKVRQHMGPSRSWIRHWFTFLTLRQLYEDHLEDECTVTALRMMVKDLLVLTQAVNEGVINVLGVSNWSFKELN